MSLLSDRWTEKVFRRLAHPSASYDQGTGILGRVVLDAYHSPHRKYHTVQHLNECFEVLDRIFPNAPTEVEVGLWFHDVVYETHDTDNEERSAAYAEEILGMLKADTQVVAKIKSLILATKHEVVPADPMAQMLVDVDLAILGEDPAKFDTYDRQIREEYVWVPDEAYKMGRKKVLQRFIDRDWVYSTKEMRRAGYEGRAQENLRRAIANLG